MPPDKSGNEVLDVAVAPNGDTHLQKVEAATITLDDVFFAEHKPPYIHLLRIDGQGTEVDILKGGRRLLSSGYINSIYFELAPMWLLSQGTSPAELFSILVTHGFECYHGSGD